MLVDHLFQCRISPWPKTAEKCGFCTGVTDRPTDRRMDGRTDRPSYRDEFLTDASKKSTKQCLHTGKCSISPFLLSFYLFLGISDPVFCEKLLSLLYFL